MKEQGKSSWVSRFLLRENSAFLSIITLGLLVRILVVVNHGLSNDELSALYRTTFHTWDDFWFYGVSNGDMHPAFYQVLLWFWVKLFGTSDIVFRLPSLIFYLLNSILIYRIGIKFFSKSGALITLALFAGLTFEIFNTVFSRPYNSGTFFLLLLFYAILKANDSENFSWRWTIIIASSVAGSGLSHYFAGLVAAIILLLALFTLKRLRRTILLSGLIACVLIVPHVNITLAQLSKGGLQWLAPPNPLWLVDFSHLFFNNSWVLCFGLFVLFISGIIVFGFEKRSSYGVLSYLIFFVSIAVGFIISYLYTPVLRELVMLFLLPFFFLPVCSRVKLPRSNEYLAIAFFMISFAHSFFKNDLLGFGHFGVFKEIAEQIDAAVEKYGQQNITFASSYNNINYINHYLKHPLTEEITDWSKENVQDVLYKRIVGSKTKYFCYSVNNHIDPPLYVELIRSRFPLQTKTFIAGNSKFFLFEKAKADSIVGKDNSCKQDTSEFQYEKSWRVSQLKKSTKPFSYYKISSDGILKSKHPLLLVVALERDGKFLQTGDFPELYLAVDQSKFVDTMTQVRFFTAFHLPNSAQPTDVIKAYIWNPEKHVIGASPLCVELVEYP